MMERSNLSRRQVLGGLSALAATTAAATAPAAAAQRSASPGFSLGTVTYNVPKDWDLSTLVQVLPAAGVDAVEFRTTHAHGVEPSLSKTRRAEVRSQCEDGGLVIWGLGTVCEFQSPDPAVVRGHIDDCRQFVQLAADLGARGVKVRPNGLPEGVPVEKTLEQIGKSLHECGRIAADHGVEIWLEVHGRGTQDPPHMRTIMDHCRHPAVGTCWNSNGTDVTNGSVAAAFELLKPELMSVHINNLWGSYPYRELFSLLRGANYDRYVLCEVASPVPPEAGPVFFQCYRGLWQELCRP
jgi:sugar phosphate isomerase/epimerase